MNSRQKEVLQSQLDDEKAVIRKLKVSYGRAMAETEAKIQAFTADIQLKKEALQSVTDASQRAALESEIQSKVYQKQYQEALKGQISAIFDNLQSKQYDTIKEYLDDSYTKGFTGTMYDLHGQGIPLILPIDQTQVVDALTMKTKLSKPLYQRLGVDIDSLKKIVNSEISRGIATGRTWAEIAQIIDRRKNINLYRASRIARTEGHRVQQTAAFDAMKKAKGKGADLVKQWDATLDDRTRPDHALLDGQIREVDEPFEVSGYQAMMPGQFGIASEDIHCRCVALQRARWALDEEELQTLKDRATYFGLDKSKDFDDFTAKYLKAAEKVATMDLDELSKIQKLKANLNGKRASMDELKEIGTAVKKYIGKYQPTEDEKAYNAAYQKVLDMCDLIRQNKLSSSSDEYRKAYYEWVDAKAKVQGLQQTRAQWLSGKLSDIRQVGTKGIESDVSAHLKNSHSKVCKSVEDAYSMYPREWVEKSIQRGTLTPKKVSRGFYSDYQHVIAISGDGGDAFQTAVHELGHRFEMAVPEILEAEKEFYSYRTDGENLRWLGNGYRRNETSRFDDFINPYMGKDYKGQAFELVSMGFEYAFTDPEKLAKDPDMESWILGLLTTY